ncbi:ALF repeat-containing protein [Streptomyces sp. NPDC048416]|uniref:ALF repeat-containing protein n=1 Tax=Streptomyces sp. NPDC048416 TaxID=3365546 RepID=UPI003715602C
MRSTRAALLVAAAALAPVLIAATPAFAAGSAASAFTTVTATSGASVTDPSQDDDRVAVSRILDQATKNRDRAVIKGANRALDTGTPEALRAFLDTGYPKAQAEDDSVATSRILYLAQQNGDKAVIKAATQALDTGTPEALRAFRTTGYPKARTEDDRVAIFVILAKPGISDALRAAAGKALDGTPEDMRYFLEVGQYNVG